MTIKGIEGLIMTTHNWGKSVAFWQGLGFELEFEASHHSGQLRHSSGGPYIFLVERPAGEAPEMQPVLSVPDQAGFEPPKAGEVDRPFEAQHWGVMEMLLRDPDGRGVSVQAPLPAGQPAH